MSRESDLRQKVVEEVQTWIGTPFHHEARLKGIGVDCLMLLAEVYEKCGVIDRVKPPHYPPDWHMHRDIERYMEGLLQYATRVEGPPQPGDVALFKFGRVFSHGTIVVEWPRLIHAYWNMGVVWGDATLEPLRDQDRRFFDPFARGER